MQFITRTIHGVLDYLISLLLVASPWIFGFADDKSSSLLALGMGGFALMYSAITDYEVGLIRLIPFPGHIFLDYLSVLGLIGAPILFAVKGVPAYVLVGAGILDLAVVSFTRKRATPDLPILPGGGVR
jgi:hypothetical protein